MSLSVVGPPGLGVQPDDRECRVTARGGAVCAGYCYPFAAAQSSTITADGVTLSNTPGDVGFPYANIRGGAGASSTDVRCGRFCIALEDIPDEGVGRVKVKGLVRAKVFGTSNATIAVGTEMHVKVNGLNSKSVLDALVANTTGGAPRKYVALALEAVTTPSDGGTIMVDFDGWDGIGSGGNI